MVERTERLVRIVAQHRDFPDIIELGHGSLLMTPHGYFTNWRVQIEPKNDISLDFIAFLESNNSPHFTMYINEKQRYFGEAKLEKLIKDHSGIALTLLGQGRIATPFSVFTAVSD